jgi:hypothetical protein
MKAAPASCVADGTDAIVLRDLSPAIALAMNEIAGPRGYVWR